MRKIRFDLWTPDEYAYPAAGGFLPNLRGYLHEDGADRPAMLVVPGGAYFLTSPTEAQNVAMRFFEAGFQAFTVIYSTATGRLFDEETTPLGTQPLRDLSRAVQAVRHHAGAWCVRPDRVAVCGFSAGGHLAGSLATRHPEVDPADAAFPGVPNRPDAVVLSYPVITTDPAVWHEGSFHALLGRDASTEALAAASLETRVGPHAPPMFVWHTMTDELVPVENSLRFAAACRAQGVPCELHVFREGRHGLSLADEDWAAGKFGEDADACMEAVMQYLAALARTRPEALPEALRSAVAADDPQAFAEAWMRFLAGLYEADPARPVPAVAVWPQLVLHWLEGMWGAIEGPPEPAVAEGE